MKTIALTPGFDEASLADEAAEVVRNGGLVCVPCAGRYRIIADLENADAVIDLMQAKGRVKKAPALIFVDSADAVGRVTESLSGTAASLAGRHWPGPLTIRVTPSDALPPKVTKQLGGKKSRIGVRVPEDGLMRRIAERSGVPLLVSSANRQKKAGESSPAQVRKTFGRRLELFLDGGDLAPGPKSTVVDIVDGKVVIEREGAIAADQLEDA